MFKYKTRAYAVDTDFAGHVHFSNYFRFAEEAEEEFMRSFGVSFREVERENFLLPKVETKCNYISPIRCGDEIEVILRISKIKDRSYRYDFQIKNLSDHQKSAEGYMVVVYVDSEKGEAVKIPEDMRRELEKIRE